MDYFIVKVEYDGSNNPIYVGRAKLGADIADYEWQITMFEYDGNGNMISQTWCDGSYKPAFMWTHRAHYTYR